MRRREPRLILIIVPLVFVSCLLLGLIGTITLLTDDDFWPQGPAARRSSTPALPLNPVAASEASFLTRYQNTALGFSLNYPAGWRKNEKTLQVIFSPSVKGLQPDNWQESALWIGISASPITSPVELLSDVLVGFQAGVQVIEQGQLHLGQTTWDSVQVNVDRQSVAEPAMAIVAATIYNQVGYYLVMKAPADQWPAIQPTFSQILTSFRFTEETVLRPTDATPPPTPTPTPTPVIYIVQPGDTLSEIALRFGVDVEALANRNGIEVPQNLRSGQRLVIPSRR